MVKSYFDIKNYIRTIPDWPKKGVMFRDITSLLEDRLVFRKLVDVFVHRYLNSEIDAVVAIDARGFIIGAPLAYELNTGFVPVRKKANFPGQLFLSSMIWNMAPVKLKCRPVHWYRETGLFSLMTSLPPEALCWQRPN